MGSPNGPLRRVILTDSPTAAEDERDLPKRAASIEPDSNSTQEDRDREIFFHQEAIKLLIEGGNS